MKLVSYTILNYKSAKLLPAQLNPNEVNTYIGLNDSGKSTLLQAIKLFFDAKPDVSFESDTSKKSVLSNSPLSEEEFENYFIYAGIPAFSGYAKNLLCVDCVFEIEEELSISLLEELNASVLLQCVLRDKKIGDSFHIMRVFDSASQKHDYYIECDDFTDKAGKPSELWNQSESNITAVQKKMLIEDKDVENRNAAGKLKKVERIFAIHKKAKLTKGWAIYDFKKDSNFFPVIKYLDWNINSEELNQLTADIISPIMGELLEPMKKQINTGVETINEKANEELQKLYTKYAGSLPESISGISANVKINLQPSVTELFVEKLTADKKIHIDEQGDGIRRQIGLGLIKALAQESLDDKNVTKKHIWCLDEPETHLFPQAQRDLANSLALLAKSHFQVLVSTHSTLFVDRSNMSDIKQVVLNNGYTEIKSTDNAQDIFSTLGVRNSDFLFYDRFISVEGPTEYEIMDYFYRLHFGSSLSDDGIQVIDLKGKNNSVHYKQILDDVFKDFQKPEDMTVYLFDKDTGHTGSNVVLLGTTADFEDEISNAVWIRAIESHCGVTITDDDINDMRARINLAEKEKKLHVFLKAFVANDPSHTEYLPSKGVGLAELLKKHIKAADDVPGSFKTAFDMARRNLIV